MREVMERRPDVDADRFHDVFRTRFGWVGVLSSRNGVRRTTLPQTAPADCVSLMGREVEDSMESPAEVAGIRERIEAYLEGDRIEFDADAVDVGDASSFLRASWSACLGIPYGETRTYKWLAEQAGRPRAPRAAGQAMARNRLPIVVPCHRVVASDGSLHGFGRGASQLDLKQRLIDLEASG